jgi:WD domain, G-beta repeat
MKQPSKRRRGVILTLKGWDKFQAAKTQVEFDENGGDSFSLEELSDRTHLALHTISRIQGRTEPVDKSSLQFAFAAFGLELCKSDYTQPSPPDDLEVRQANPQYDWGEAPDVSVFYGRSEELVQLRQWVLEERCRLVALLGIGGIGKSTLAVKLGLQIQGEFEFDKSVFATSLKSIYSLALSPDGKLLATGDQDGQIHLWQMADRKNLLTLKGHKDLVWTVAFSPDGQICVLLST